MITTLANPPAASVMMARSGIIYVVGELLVPPTLVAYDLKLWVWRGLLVKPLDADEYKYRRYPDKNAKGVFNISKVIQGYFIDLDYNLPLETSGNLAVNFQVEYSWWDGSANHDAVIQGVVQAQFGYNLFTDNVNQVILQNDDGFLTDLPSGMLTDNGSGYQLIFIRHTAVSTATGYKITTDSGVTEDKNFVTPQPPTSSEETLLTLQAGYEYLSAALKAGISNWYDIQLIDRTGVIGKPFRFYIQNNCKYEMFKVDWINRYGVWDRLFMYGNNQQSLEVSNQDAMRYAIFDYDHSDTWKQGDGQFVVFNKNGRSSIRLNTGWITEDHWDALQQLLLSERVVVDGHSALLNQKSIIKQTSVTDKMINYTFDFTFAFESINTVG